MNIADGETIVFTSLEECGPYTMIDSSIVSCGKGDRITTNRVIPIGSNWEIICEFPRCIDDKNAIKVNIRCSATRPVKDHKMNIACNNPQFFKQVTCPSVSDRWIHLTCIPKVRPYAVCGNVLLYSIKLKVSVDECPSAKPQCALYDDSFTDFNLITENGSSVPVHKACMAANSDVFKTMLAGEWKETANGCLQIKGLQVTLDTLKHLKDYMYLGTLPEDGLRPLLLIADCYMIRDLRLQCIQKLALTVTWDNLLDLLEFSILNKITELTVTILVMTPRWVVDNVYVRDVINQRSLKADRE